MPARSQPEPLAEIQRAIAGALMRPLTASEGMRRESRVVAQQFIKPNDRLSAFERLQIYNQQYWWRIMGSFREDFRGLLAVLGERKFERFAVAYIEQCGSTSWDLAELGAGVEAFARAHPALLAPRETLGLEMIRVEWARAKAFSGAEKPALNPRRLRGDPGRLRIGLQPYVTLLELSYPIDRMLGRLRQRTSEAASNAVTDSGTRRPARLRGKPDPVCLAVHRVDLAVYYKRLEPAAYRLLAALRDGATLDEACAAAFGGEPPEDAPQQIQTWFATWMRLGWLV